MRSTAVLASSVETCISDITISTWPSTSSVMPCAARTASSTVGGSRRTRRRPSLVSHTSLMSHLSYCWNDLAKLASRTHFDEGSLLPAPLHPRQSGLVYNYRPLPQ